MAKKKKEEVELLSQRAFARLDEVNQSEGRISLLISLGRLPVKIIAGKKLIEKTESNINIAKRKNNDKKK